MNCFIVFKSFNPSSSKIVYNSENFNEAVCKLEELGLYYIADLQGLKYLNDKKIYKKVSQRKDRGLFLVSYTDKIVVYNKEKDGLLYNGKISKICSYELFYCKNNKVHNRFESEMDVEYTYNFGLCMDEILDLEQNKIPDIARDKLALENNTDNSV